MWEDLTGLLEYMRKNDVLEDDGDEGLLPQLDIYAGKDVEMQCLQIQYDALRVIGASNETLTYVRNSGDSAWWDEKYVCW